MNALLHIFDRIQTHRKALWIIFTVVLIPLVVLAALLRYNENILDFLPATEEERAAFERMQSQQAASRLYLIVEGDSLRDEAIEEINYQLSIINYQLSTDPAEQLDALYAQLPYLISDSVYAHLDSYFTPEAIDAALQRDKAILATPGASTLIPVIRHDPLGLVQLSIPLDRSPKEIRTLHSQLSTKKSFAFLDLDTEATETKENAALVDAVTAVTKQVAEAYPHLSIRWIGAPVIAVGNARRIKLDSMLCIAFSLVLITVLLIYAFPRKRDIGLIILSVSFGWLFGMAVLRIVTPSVSAIVLGIGSVLIGIAVNYPLHLLVHQRYTASVRQTLEEVLSPLVIGNITTVGAFLALIPLQSAAMRHLGIFAASMLIGTILFCIFILPHLMSAEPTPVREIKIPVNFQLSTRRPWSVLVITLLLLPFTIHHSPLFDSTLSHINYMTPQQRADMAVFDARVGDASQWTAYWQTHDAEQVIRCIQTQAAGQGFHADAFAPFYEMLRHADALPAFELSDLTQRLSDDFDYIGLCCSVIVFVFLCFSFRNIWLALIAFVPMLLSWVWIIAFMQLFGLQFNIVNIILASFIFGQGDDYTIFIVEGLQYEHRTGRPILPQYRQSILLSALIMLIGIGILAFAVHPAMHSLGVITLLGMSVVLLLSLTLPPLLFRWYIRIKEKISHEG